MSSDEGGELSFDLFAEVLHVGSSWHRFLHHQMMRFRWENNPFLGGVFDRFSRRKGASDASIRGASGTSRYNLGTILSLSGLLRLITVKCAGRNRDFFVGCDGCVKWEEWGLETLDCDELASSRRSSGLKTLEVVFLGETPRFQPLREIFRRFSRLKRFSRRSWDNVWRGPLRFYALPRRKSGLGGVGVLGSPSNVRLEQFLNAKTETIRLENL